MALDSIVLSNIVNELKLTLMGGRIDKIHQTEKEELTLTVRGGRVNHKLLLTANSSYPRLHLTTHNKVSPPTPPMFCMLLRKHLSSGKITDITMPHFERIVEFHIEAMGELGDKEHKKLIIEIMGRHSNIILTKEDYTIIDSIKHIASDKSSVRVVLPGRPYVYPPNQDKLNPRLLTYATFEAKIKASTLPLVKALYTSFTGLSPLFAKEVCFQAGIDPETVLATCEASVLKACFDTLMQLLEVVAEGTYTPCLYLDDQGLPIDFYSLPLTVLDHAEYKPFASPSELLAYYYHDRSERFVVSQKTADIKKLILNFIDRTLRKQAIQEKALQESETCETFKIYGELITAYSYQIPPRSKNFVTQNYYEEPYAEINIPLDADLTAIENAQRYFKRYSKAKRTSIAAKEQLLIIREDLDYLQSVLLSLDLLQTPQDIDGLRQELVDMGYLKKRKAKGPKTQKVKVPYMLYQSSSGLPIYVGKNNYQNDELTMKFARSNDLWLHIKEGPGSHVIVRAQDQEPIDDISIIEAAMLAAHFSSGKHSSNVPIDYTFKKFVKKVPNAKPGMVIYTNFKTAYVTPEEAFLKTLSQDI